MIPLTEREIDALRSLMKYGPMTCANLGEEIWIGGRGGGYRPLSIYRGGTCPYARPAGRIVHRLERLGLADRKYDGHRTLYRVTPYGEEEYLAHRRKSAAAEFSNDLKTGKRAKR